MIRCVQGAYLTNKLYREETSYGGTLWPGCVLIWFAWAMGTHRWGILITFCPCVCDYAFAFLLSLIWACLTSCINILLLFFLFSYSFCSPVFFVCVCSLSVLIFFFSRLCSYLHTYFSIPFIFSFAYLFLSVNLAVHFLYLFLCPFCLCFYLFVWVFICLSFYLSIFLFICVSIYLYIFPFPCLSLFFSPCLS